MLKSIGDIWFGCSREVGWFSEGLLREVILYSLYSNLAYNFSISVDGHCMYISLFIASIFTTSPMTGVQISISNFDHAQAIKLLQCIFVVQVL